MAEIKIDPSTGRPIIKNKTIKELPKPLAELMNKLKKDIKRKEDGGMIKYKDGDLIDVSRGQAGYNFKGIF
jgi:hypothetical protein|tara:strand:+ start:373 stop:585 length:213 start_codon:yes stop_codon:yes gene_type:complete